MVTLDLARLESRQLIARSGGNIYHIQADGNRLPFRNHTVDIILSNMALDFMSDSPEQAQTLFEEHGFQVVHNSGVVGKRQAYEWCEIDAIYAPCLPK